MRVVGSGGYQCPTRSAACHRPLGPRTGSSTAAEAIHTALETTIRRTSRSFGMAAPSRSLSMVGPGEREEGSAFFFLAISCQDTRLHLQNMDDIV